MKVCRRNFKDLNRQIKNISIPIYVIIYLIVEGQNIFWNRMLFNLGFPGDFSDLLKILEQLESKLEKIIGI